MTASTRDAVDWKKVDGIIERIGAKKSNLIAILQAVQEEFRYLPDDIMTYIGTKIEGLSPATVFGVATFYAQFSLKPKGQYKINVCLGTACYVKGAEGVLDRLKKELKMDVGDCTEDGKFSLDACRCVGACGLAPVMLVDEVVYGKLKPAQVAKILDSYK